MSIITLCTDFGVRDSYVASMKGIILGINPSAVIVDASHEIPAHNIACAAFVLNGYYNYFPKSTIHVAVVDPGVGSQRNAMIVKIKDYVFVGPDNGVFSSILLDHPAADCYSIDTKHALQHRLSQTFHGRDIFAPVAARLSIKWDKSLLREKIKYPVILGTGKPVIHEKSVTGEIIYVDHFGNLITNIPAGIVHTGEIGSIVVKGYKIKSMVDTYEQCDKKQPCALINSFNSLEIAINSHSVHKVLGINAGDKVTVLWR